MYWFCKYIQLVCSDCKDFIESRSRHLNSISIVGISQIILFKLQNQFSQRQNLKIMWWSVRWKAQIINFRMHTESASLYHFFLLYDTISTNLKSNLKAAHWNRQSNIEENMNLKGLIIARISLESSRISKKCHQMFQNGSRESSWLDV